MEQDELAQDCAAAMWREDQASQGLGMAIESVGAGRARLAMTVEARMTNGHGMCHGGFIFTLADSAFAFACNSRNARSVAAQCAITFLRPASLGERLVSEACERSVAGRTGIYDVTVTGDGGAVIAEFRGHSRTIGGSLLERKGPQG